MAERLDAEILPRLERPGRQLGPFHQEHAGIGPASRGNIVLLWPGIPADHELPKELRPLDAHLHQLGHSPRELACAPPDDLEAALRASGLPLFARPSWRALGTFGLGVVWATRPGELLGLLSLLEHQLCDRVVIAGPLAERAPGTLRALAAVLPCGDPAAVARAVAQLAGGIEPDGLLSRLPEPQLEPPDRERLALARRLHAGGARHADSPLAGGEDMWQEAWRELPGPDPVPPVAPPQGPPPGATALDRNDKPAAPGHRRRPATRWQRWRDRAPRDFWYRIEFATTGRLRWFGPGELSLLWRSACEAAGHPVATQGVARPRPKLQFGPPVPVGVEGRRDYVDLAFGQPQDRLHETLAAHLPDGLQLLRSCFLPATTRQRIPLSAAAVADYEARLGTLPPGQHESIGERIRQVEGPHDETGGTMNQATGLELELLGDEAVLRFRLQHPAEGPRLKPVPLLAQLLGVGEDEARRTPMRRTALLVPTRDPRRLLDPMQQAREERVRHRAIAKLCA